MLLDLAASSAEFKRVSVSSLCYASGAPATTALRWIAALVDCGLVSRTPDSGDGRRVFVDLTKKGHTGIVKYFSLIDQDAISVL
jgi:DNA-binding MarR family transcriptional regulator